MKHNFLISAIFLILVVGFYVPVSYSQPTYQCILANDAQTSGTTYQFDVYLLRTGSTSFELSSVQFGFTFLNTTLNGGTMTAVWKSGSSEFLSTNLPFPSIVVGTVSSTWEIECPASPIPSTPGTGTIISNTGLGTKVGTIVLTNTVVFSGAKLNIAYTTGVLLTKVYAFVGGVSTGITNATWHIKDVSFTNPTLPIELNTFMSNVSERQVNLSWETNTEVNSSKFEIERALSGTKDATVTWTAVGTVPASGSSNSPKKYSYTEKDLQAGKYQYKLKMIDNNGAYKFSDVVESEVALPKNFEVSQNYPNPFNPSTRINYSIPFDSKVTVEVFTITGERLGQIVNEEQSAGYYTVNFSSSTLHKSIASGVYIYRVIAVNKTTGNVSSSIKKMILLK